jgi:phosphatidylethanolamine N-methyltransferase
VRASSEAGENAYYTAESFMGVTADGERFLVPELPSVVTLLVSPRHWDVSSFFIAVFGALSVYVTVAQGRDEPSWAERATGWTFWPRDNILYVCVFWRLMYDVALGFVLKAQSERQVLTRWVASVKATVPPPEEGGLAAAPFRARCLGRLLGRTKRSCLETMPAPFSAWVVSRYISNTILCNDVGAFCLVVLRCWNFEGADCDEATTVCLGTAACYVLGTLLCLSSLFSKRDAHAVIGAYAWYWGDFFFLAERELIFDGIFELFPHPMYTVGYGWMYGAGLMSRSYAVFATALFCHMMQMAFLHFFEEPHIEKTYGSSSKHADGSPREDGAQPDDGPPKPRARRRRANVLAVTNFDVFRASDIILVLFVGATLAVAALGVDLRPGERTCGGTAGGAPCIFPFEKDGESHDACTFRRHVDLWCRTAPPSAAYAEAHALVDGSAAPWGECNCGRLGTYFFIGHALFWRLANSLGLGYVLNRQAKDRVWTAHFRRQGLSDERAFDSWKRLYNMTNTMTIVSFLMAVWYFFEATLFRSLEPRNVAALLASAAMWGLQLWSYSGCYEVLGDFGWFYGDFFVKRTDGPKLSYTGIYRYWNNPLSTFGFLGFYACALASDSAVILSLAMVSHALHLLFTGVVERPHVEAMYKNQFRQHNALDRRLREGARRGLDAVRNIAMSPRSRSSSIASPRRLMQMMLPGSSGRFRKAKSA